MQMQAPTEEKKGIVLSRRAFFNGCSEEEECQAVLLALHCLPKKQVVRKEI